MNGCFVVEGGGARIERAAYECLCRRPEQWRTLQVPLFQAWRHRRPRLTLLRVCDERAEFNSGDWLALHAELGGPLAFELKTRVFVTLEEGDDFQSVSGFGKNGRVFLEKEGSPPGPFAALSRKLKVDEEVWTWLREPDVEQHLERWSPPRLPKRGRLIKDVVEVPVKFANLPKKVAAAWATRGHEIAALPSRVALLQFAPRLPLASESLAVELELATSDWELLERASERLRMAPGLLLAAAHEQGQ